MPTVRSTASVIVTDAVDGRPRRRSSSTRRTLATATQVVKVHPDVWAMAKQITGPAQRIQIVSETEVLVVNRPL